jgi:uncharacterized membrane protein
MSASAWVRFAFFAFFLVLMVVYLGFFISFGAEPTLVVLGAVLVLTLALVALQLVYQHELDVKQMEIERLQGVLDCERARTQATQELLSQAWASSSNNYNFALQVLASDADSRERLRDAMLSKSKDRNKHS